MFSKNFSIIEFVARELHLPEVEGVEIVCFFPQIYSKYFFFLRINLDFKKNNYKVFLTWLLFKLAFRKSNAC